MAREITLSLISWKEQYAFERKTATAIWKPIADYFI